MFSQFFGSYLLDKQLVTREQLKEVFAVQDATRLKLGVLAVDSGFMKAEDIETVHARQTAVDKKFGELAIEMGFLTKYQLEAILATQKKEHLLMGQTLIDKGFMTLKQLQDTFENYKLDNKLSDEQFKALQDNNVEKIVEAFLKFDTIEENEFYQDYVVLLINNIVRFVCGGISIKGFRKAKKYSVEWSAEQQIKGKKELYTAATMDEETFVKFAEIFSKEKCDGPDELARDCVCEFMNLQNGIFLVNNSNNGVELGMNPPLCRHNASGAFTKDAYIISLELEIGDVEIVMSSEMPVIKEI